MRGVYGSKQHQVDGGISIISQYNVPKSYILAAQQPALAKETHFVRIKEGRVNYTPFK